MYCSWMLFFEKLAYKNWKELFEECFFSLSLSFFFTARWQPVALAIYIGCIFKLLLQQFTISSLLFVETCHTVTSRGLEMVTSIGWLCCSLVLHITGDQRNRQSYVETSYIYKLWCGRSYTKEWQLKLLNRRMRYKKQHLTLRLNKIQTVNWKDNCFPYSIVLMWNARHYLRQDSL